MDGEDTCENTDEGMGGGTMTMAAPTLKGHGAAWRGSNVEEKLGTLSECVRGVGTNHISPS